MDTMTHNDTSAFYDAIAQYYPYFYRDWDTQMEREGLLLKSLFRGRGIKRVLDAWSGAGGRAIPLATMDYDVTAADPSEQMLRKAAQLANKRGIRDRIRFMKTDLLHLSDRVTGTFDAVIAKNNALPHLLTDSQIMTAISGFHQLLRPGGLLIIGMRDFAPFMEDRPRFLPGVVHRLRDGREMITFDVWEWHDGPPILARQNLFITVGSDNNYKTVKHRVVFRPLSTDEVKVVLLEVGFAQIDDRSERAERLLIAVKPD